MIVDIGLPDGEGLIFAGWHAGRERRTFRYQGLTVILTGNRFFAGRSLYGLPPGVRAFGAFG